MLDVQGPTRREFIGMLGAAGLVAACGEEPAAEPTATTPGFPRTVDSGFGDLVIPAQPARVAATADRDQLDVLLAMGVTPVLYGYSGDYPDVPPWIDAAALEGVAQATMPGAFEPNLERITAARPDLIVDAWSEPAAFEALARIAPTIEVKLDNTDSWRDAQRLAGSATGEESAAEDAIQVTEAEIATHAAGLSQYRDLTMAIAFIDGDALVMIPGTEIGGRIVAELGMTVLAPPDGASDRFSLEAIPDLLGEADVILSYDFGALGGQEQNPLWRALPAVTRGGYVTVDIASASAAYQESTLSLRWAAAPLAEAIRAGADGEGDRLT